MKNWHYRKLYYCGIPLLCVMLFGMSDWQCGKKDEFRYRGGVTPEKYPGLAGKRIFIDPGHGGKGATDRFRTGPNGITEEAVNLRVGLYLRDMLARAGAGVQMSREKDEDIPLNARVVLVNTHAPDLLVSIHHNGSVRRVDGVNYPCVMVWGSALNAGPSLDFASLLQNEFHRIMEDRGRVVSDFSVFTETGAMILRETRYTCPGVIGEAGFFSQERHAVRLADLQYNQLEAEAYFLAIAEFFNRGVPAARMQFSCPVDNDGFMINRIRDTKPILALRLEGGGSGIPVDRQSVRATVDDIPAGCTFIDDSLCVIDYGERLYPGAHSIRFSFRNARGRHSMIYRAGFTVDIQKGDYDRLVGEGLVLVKNRRTCVEGLRRLLAGLSMCYTSPDDDRLLWNIANGFALTGDALTAEYYRARILHCYPGSTYAPAMKHPLSEPRMPVEFRGKELPVSHDPALVNVCREHTRSREVQAAPRPVKKTRSSLNELI